jgi:hypothetical protein
VDLRPAGSKVFERSQIKRERGEKRAKDTRKPKNRLKSIKLRAETQDVPISQEFDL